ncbi:hypothetical protein NC651_030015 [Populus alba x Populus x berolinensis]|nr:hypothetical protein NC651_030015 [Populus alba x Populus x berolinensis]
MQSDLVQNGSVYDIEKELQAFDESKSDLKGIHEDGVRRREIVEQMCNASETWVFFQAVNHGISKNFMEGMKAKAANWRDIFSWLPMIQILKNIQKSAGR